MKNSFNINVVLGTLCLLLAVLFNQFTWLLFFDFDGLISLYNKLFLGIVDLFLFISGIFFLKNRNDKKFLSSYIKIVSFNSILLLFLLIVVEIFFGNWFNPGKLNQLNIVRDKQIQFILQGLYPTETDEILYSRDKWGFRGTYPDVNDIDILTIGGSTVDQRLIYDGLTFQDVMQNTFKDHGEDVYVVNAGVDGQSTYGHIKNFDWWFPHIPKLKVKYYLFFVGVNDFYKGESDSFDDLLGESPSSVIDEIKGTIRARSALFHLYRTVEGVVIANAYGLTHGAGRSYDVFSTQDWVTEGKLFSYETIMKDRLDAYERRLNILCRNVESVGSVPMFVTQSMRRTYELIDGRLLGKPDLGEYDGRSYNGVDYYYMRRLMNGRVKKVCIDNNVVFIDMDRELEFDLKIDFYDYAHNTPSGAKKIGKYLYNRLNYLF